MALFIFGGLVALLFYLPLRYLKNLWEKEEIPKWSSIVAGVFAWGALLSLCVMAVGFFQPIVGMFTAPQMGQGFELGFLALGVAMLAKLNVVYPEFLDLARMKPFFFAALRFENLARQRMILSEELDKFEIRRVHKEVTGTDLKVEQKPVRRPQKSQEEIRREVEQLQQRRIVTPHLQMELNALNRTEAVDISDSWKINSLRTSAHQLYDRVKSVRIDPKSRAISLAMDFGELDAAPLKQSTGVFLFYQELYEFLHAMATQNWMKPYLPYFDMIRLEGSRTELDEFARVTSFLFLRLDMRMSELRVREGKFFNPAELPSIASVQFQNGEAIS